MTKNKFNLKLWFYRVLAISLVGWGWATLYLHSYGNIWGGKDDAAAKAELLKRTALTKLSEMEKKGASPAEIFDQRMQLSLQYSEGKEHVAARKMLQDESDALIKLPESEENFGRRVRVEEQVALTYIDEGLYHEASESLKRAANLAKQMEETYFSEDGRLLSVALTNETGVLTYLEANSTLDSIIRDQTFNHCQTIFEKLLTQIDSLESDPTKLTAESKERLTHIKSRVLSNLKQVKEDRSHEDEYRKT